MIKQKFSQVQNKASIWLHRIRRTVVTMNLQDNFLVFLLVHTKLEKLHKLQRTVHIFSNVELTRVVVLVYNGSSLDYIPVDLLV